MSTTAQEVFETAMNLMDEVNESTGAAVRAFASKAGSLNSGIAEATA